MRLNALVFLVLLFALTQCSPQTERPTPPNPSAKPKVVVGGLAIPKRDQTEVRPSPNAWVVQSVGKAQLTVSYGRPGVKGRTIFGGLEPWGEVWRAGANEATVFATTDDLLIQGQWLPKGVYALFMIPQTKEWVMVWNRQADQWGAFNYDQKQDALRINIKPERIPLTEWLTYRFENLQDRSVALLMEWEETRIRIPISLK